MVAKQNHKLRTLSDSILVFQRFSQQLWPKNQNFAPYGRNIFFDFLAQLSNQVWISEVGVLKRDAQTGAMVAIRLALRWF